MTKIFSFVVLIAIFAMTIIMVGIALGSGAGW